MLEKQRTVTLRHPPIRVPGGVADDIGLGLDNTAAGSTFRQCPHQYLANEKAGERGRIVETEAYVVGDAAGHAFRGMTQRNRSLFLERGHAYIYLAYGSSYMLNVSSEMPEIGAGVLIRALEPLEGIPIMQLNRGIERLRDLARARLHQLSG